MRKASKTVSHREQYMIWKTAKMKRSKKTKAQTSKKAPNQT